MSLNFPNLLKFGGKGSNYFPKKRIKTKHFVPRRENIDRYCSDNQRQPVPMANHRQEKFWGRYSCYHLHRGCPP